MLQAFLVGHRSAAGLFLSSFWLVSVRGQPSIIKYPNHRENSQHIKSLCFFEHYPERTLTLYALTRVYKRACQYKYNPKSMFFSGWGVVYVVHPLCLSPSSELAVLDRAQHKIISLRKFLTCHEVIFKHGYIYVVCSKNYLHSKLAG